LLSKKIGRQLRRSRRKLATAELDALNKYTEAWSTDVTATQRGVDWQMKIDDARTKLKSVYPTIKL